MILCMLYLLKSSICSLKCNSRQFAPPVRKNLKASRLLFKEMTTGSGKRVVSVLGGPGAGKTTVCRELSRTGMCHISAGELLREAAARGNPEVAVHLAAGTLVPTGLACSLVLAEVVKSPAGLVLLDGFPRELESLACFERNCRTLDLAFLLECRDAIRAARVNARADSRADDRPNTITTRTRVYCEQTGPLLECLKARGILRTIDSELPKKKVYQQVLTVIEDELEYNLIK